MTHHHQTNGASLEDCHTNFFALTELCGIKWRKLVWGEGGGGGAEEGGEGSAPLEDPVVGSYARCLAGDILCVWRRVSAPSPPNADPYDMSVPPPPPPPPLSLRAAKELWIFWYGEEPDLSGLVAPELVSCQSEQGSWESGLSYECRSLLFKALHNLIERCLLSRDFVRLGKWFVQPYDGDEDDVGKSPWHLSFSFAFFVHGESTVCASVDVRQHPPVRTLTPQRLAAAARRPQDAAAAAHHAKVILAPFGLEGVLTGSSWSESEAGTARLADAWRQLYPLEQGSSCVEVMAGGVRLRYPASYVLLTDMEPARAGGGAEPAPAPHPLSAHLPRTPAATMAERTVRALTTNHQPLSNDRQAMEMCNGEVGSEKMDVDFVDPTRKTACTCSKRRGAGRSAGGARGSRRHQPFHRRPRPAAAAAASSASAAHAPHTPQPGAGVCSPGSCGGGSPAAPASAPPSAGPAPASPSHLAASAHQLGGALHTPAPTPDPHAPPTPVPPPSATSARQHYAQSYLHGLSHKSESTWSNQHPENIPHHAKASPSEVKVSCSGAGAGPGAGGGAGGGEGGGGAASGAELLRLPVLLPEERQQEPLDDEHTLHMLYDYTAVRAWLDHPVKRFKTEDSGFREDLTHPKGFGNNTDLYRGHDHIEMATVQDHNSYTNPDLKQEQNDDVKDCKNLFTSDGLFPSIKDLDQIFDNSDDAASGDETLQIQTPPDSNKSGGEEVRLTSGGGGTRCVRAEELSKMFPTPPSMEAHTQASPGAFTLPDDPSHTSTHLPTRLHAPSPSPDPIEDWSYVFKPPTVCKYVGSSKYAPLATLPSQLLPPVTLPAHAMYRPRWQQEKETPTAGSASGSNKRPASPLPAVHSAGTISAPASVGCPGSAGAVSTGIGASPALRPPPPYAPSPPSPASPCASPRAHACPLLLNVLLADTVLNIFRDHNFDSCTLCVCNASRKVVGNIRGADCNTYLMGGAPTSPGESPPGSPAQQPYDDDPIRCSCGFSAVVNRRLAHRSGLFYEDEMEITGLAEDPGNRSLGRGLSGVAELVLSQCSGLGGAASALARAAHAAASARPPDEHRLNLLEYTDGGEAAALALRAAAGGASSASCTIHRWPFIGARGPCSSRDVVRLMRRLRPMLQDAIQKRCCGARMWDGVTGPLTWRQFHRLAGRGTEDLCEPQPVPPLLVGHDRDWLSLSPYALRHWERLALEPYSYARDVAYAVLAPDGDALAEPLRIFFRELSSVYESCRLGRHAPLWRIAKDGVVRASVTPDRDAASRDDWVGDVPPGRLGECIRAYAETLRTVLVPQLANVTLDRTLFEQEGCSRSSLSSMERTAPSPMRPPSTPDHPPTPNSQSDQEGDGGGCGSGGGSGSGPGPGVTGPSPASWEEEEEGGAPALVLYVVEPPRAHAHAAQALHALLRLAARASTHLQHHNLTVKIISLEGVCEAWGLSGGARPELRALAFSVFTCARRQLSHTPHIKSLTGFGTAADAQLFLKNKDEKNRAGYRLYSPAFVLAPAKAIKDVADSFGQTNVADQCAVLYLSYCLSQDQSSLLAVATDARGELLETAAINIHVPGRSRRRRAPPARRLGLTKLMDFILGVMSQSAQPWRLVVGRIGRIGHGELKGWSWLLSRKNLERASKSLHDICTSCKMHYAPGQSTAPCILSACLVSTEPDSCLRLMADRFTPDERFSQASVASHLHTPRDVTATHILVFPTSATTQSAQSTFQEQHINGNENDDLFPVLPENEDDMPEGMDGIDNMNDLFHNVIFGPMWTTNSPPGAAEVGDGDGAGSRDGSPTRRAHARGDNSPYGQSDDATTGSEQVGTVLQQPLALGYLVSTAPLGAMPCWWWAGCAHLRDACPAFLKNALHLHSPTVQQSTDEMLLPAVQCAQHPLDSNITTDVLRYVLEGYNALSWLALDGNTHDRLSCLPLHVQVLMQLYHTALALS